MYYNDSPGKKQQPATLPEHIGLKDLKEGNVYVVFTMLQRRKPRHSKGQTVLRVRNMARTQTQALFQHLVHPFRLSEAILEHRHWGQFSGN